MPALACLLMLLLATWAQAKDDIARVEVIGEYRYTYGDRESLEEARQLAYTLAVRRAIESYSIFVESTATVQNYQTIKDLVQAIASGSLEDLKILEQSEHDKTVYCKVRGYVKPEEVRAILHTKVETAQRPPEPIDQNATIKILSTRAGRGQYKTWYATEDDKAYVWVIYKQELPLKSTFIMIDYFDKWGTSIGGDRVETQKDLMQGEVRTVVFWLSNHVHATRVWLPK